MNLALEDRACLVTGGSRGLGRAMVEALAAEGAQVMAVGRDTRALAELEGKSEGRIHGQACDLLDRNEVVNLPRRAAERFGKLEVLVNAAGVAPVIPFREQTAASWDETLELNLMAPVGLISAAAPEFAKADGGKVINVASVAGLKGKPGLVAYGASKGALVALTRGLAVEWARDNIQVNAIAPGAFATEMQSAVLNDPELMRRRTKRIPAQRMAEAAEIGPLACYLASPQSAFVTGSVFVVDGGETSRL